MTTVADELIALLDRERDALRSGDVQHVNRLCRHKAALVVRLEAQVDALDGATLRRLHEAAQRTEAAITAALAGVRDARAQITSALCRDERVYARNGVRARIASGHPTLEKRA